MKQQKTSPGKFFCLAVMLALGLTACKRNHLPGGNECLECVKSTAAVNSLDANGNSAAAHIAASEKLEIPSAVALPDNFPCGNSRVATYYAVGVQKYKAREKAGSPASISRNINIP